MDITSSTGSEALTISNVTGDDDCVYFNPVVMSNALILTFVANFHPIFSPSGIVTSQITIGDQIKKGTLMLPYATVFADPASINKTITSTMYVFGYYE